MEIQLTFFSVIYCDMSFMTAVRVLFSTLDSSSTL